MQITLNDNDSDNDNNKNNKANANTADKRHWRMLAICFH